MHAHASEQRSGYLVGIVGTADKVEEEGHGVGGGVGDPPLPWPYESEGKETVVISESIKRLEGLGQGSAINSSHSHPLSQIVDAFLKLAS